MPKYDLEATRLAQAAYHNGPNAAERPAYDSSPNGMAFAAGLWARSVRIEPHEAHMSRGLTVILNRRYKINFNVPRNLPPIVTTV